MLNRFGKLIFIDLETTGPNPASDCITEIGIVEVGAAGVKRWSTLVNPQAPIPPFIRHLTGISDDMVRDAPTFDALHEDVLQRLRGGLLIAHNARFDYGFLRNAFRRYDIALHCEVLCTVKLSRKLFPEEAKHSLDALVARHGLSTHTRHRALADADLLWQFWRKLEATLPADALLAATRQLLRRPTLPAHMDPDLLDDIPDAPGVYIFYGEHDVPLHIGRAPHLRQRVLSHFHADHPSYKDVRLARQLHRIEWHETAGDVGAQLLETQLAKDLQPVHDCAARREHESCAWQLRADAAGKLRPVLAYARDQDFGRCDRLYGLFNSRRKAETALRALAEQHGLCPVMLGLESGTPGQLCPAYRSQHCRGACAGMESPVQHQERLHHALAALKLQAWPYAGPVGLIETGAGGRRDIHVIDNWCCIGTAHTEHDVRHLLDQAPPRPAFDIDTYKIVSCALKLGKVAVRPLFTSPVPSSIPAANAMQETLDAAQVI